MLHVRLRVLLWLAREAVREGGLGMRHFLGGAHAEHDREALSRQRAQTGKGGHRRLGFSDALRLVHRRVPAVQEEVPKGAIGVQVAAQDRLVVHLEFQEGGKGRHSLTVRKAERGTITLSWHDLARLPRGGSCWRDRIRHDADSLDLDFYPSAGLQIAGAIAPLELAAARDRAAPPHLPGLDRLDAGEALDHLREGP